VSSIIQKRIKLNIRRKTSHNIIHAAGVKIIPIIV
jgi:hypothetical protein